MNTDNVTSIISEAEAVRDGMPVAKLWLEKIAGRIDAEKDWRKEAKLAVAAFEARSKTDGAAHAKPMFNIFHSNIQTLGPAVYNSTPVPDVRRRYGDKDAIARLGATIAERALQASLDGYDFDHVMKRSVRAAILPGRGQARIRYTPTFGQDTDPDGINYDVISGEDVRAERVPWDRFTHGDAETWSLVPWVAYKHDLAKDEVSRLLMPEQPQLPEPPMAPEMDDMADPMEVGAALAQHQAAMQQYETTAYRIVEDYKAKRKEAEQRLERLPFGNAHKSDVSHDTTTPTKGILKSVPCWEVWDKATRTIIWVCENDTDLPLKVFPDPLGLTQFFDCPRPLMQTECEDSLLPVCPHNVYSDLIEEIDDTTRRIKATINDMRVRALSDPALSKDLELLAKAQDGEVVSSNQPENFTRGGGNALGDLIAWWPVEQDVKVLQALMQHREAIKQIIYEVTGLSDILRGATDAGETATAQQIKATWGSQRVQELQQEVARFAKDLFRLKSEVIFGKFQDKTIRDMTLLPEPVNEQAIAASVPPPQMGHNGGPPMEIDPTTAQPPQADPQAMQAMHQQAIQQAVQQAQQQAEEQFQAALETMRSKLSFFRVDIETDSTIKADMQRDQQRMNEFLGMAAQFGQAMASVAPVLPALVPGLTKIFTSLVRKTMKLGKNVEDILDQLDEAGQQPPTPQGGGVDPQAEAEVAGTQDEMADRQHARDMEMEQAKGQNIDRKNVAIGMKAQAEEQNFGRQMFLKQIEPAMPPQGGMRPGQQRNGGVQR